jgi:nicotinamidase-related amidase
LRVPPNWSTVVEDLAPQASDLRIMKRQWGAFPRDGARPAASPRGIPHDRAAGISTNVGVESTARDAFERGYEQVFDRRRDGCAVGRGAREHAQDHVPPASAHPTTDGPVVACDEVAAMQRPEDLDPRRLSGSSR